MSYILKYNGASTPNVEELKTTLDQFEVKLIDASSLPQMALVDGITDQSYPKLQKMLPDWNFYQQNKSFNIPDTRFKVNKK